MLAARFLGVRELGLDRLLLKYLDIQPVRSQQKTDWARRPLTTAQEHYAAEDVRHLIELRDRVLADLRAMGRDTWLEEECEALAALQVPERPSEEDGYRRIRGASRLLPRGPGRAPRSLPPARDVGTRGAPAAVQGPEPGDVDRAGRAPASRSGGSRRNPGTEPSARGALWRGPPGHVARGLTERLPESPRTPRTARPAVTAASRQRAEALRKWRTEASEVSGLDPGVLLPQRLIDALALDPPTDLAALQSVPGLRRWRVDAFGPAILATLRTT